MIFFFFCHWVWEKYWKIEFIFIELNNIIIALRLILGGWTDMHEILSTDLVILSH